MLPCLFTEGRYARNVEFVDALSAASSIFKSHFRLFRSRRSATTERTDRTALRFYPSGCVRQPMTLERPACFRPQMGQRHACRPNGCFPSGRRQERTDRFRPQSFRLVYQTEATAVGLVAVRQIWLDLVRKRTHVPVLSGPISAHANPHRSPHVRNRTTALHDPPTPWSSRTMATKGHDRCVRCPRCSL